MKPEEFVVSYLTERGLTLFAAESCTGGLVCKRITDVPGASRVLKGGVVSYTNGIKTDLLGVLPETIARHTEVSEQCAAEMAQGARKCPAPTSESPRQDMQAAVPAFRRE